jgi:membrane-bound lytic murein transglycosylase D
MTAMELNTKRMAAWLGRREWRVLAVGGTFALFGLSLRPAQTGKATFDLPAVVQGLTQPELRPLEEYAEGWDLANLDHERVDFWVELFTTERREKFGEFLERKGIYEEMIRARLADRGMPQDLIYLAMIESGFNPKAQSVAKASGLWQFIRETGERYGLEVNRAVDERLDPVKATDAALDYLQELHARFGSWYLAAAAYNTGENRVARIMRQQTGSERGTDQDYYRIWNHLPRETRDYVPLMIAAARISKDLDAYGFDHIEPAASLAYREVEVRPATSLAAIARAQGTTVDMIRALNPHLKLARTRNDMASVIRVPDAGAVAAD